MFEYYDGAAELMINEVFDAIIVGVAFNFVRNRIFPIFENTANRLNITITGRKYSMEKQTIPETYCLLSNVDQTRK